MMQNYSTFQKLRNTTWCLVAALALICSNAYANNVTLSNVSLSGNQVKFDITWDNSWRNTSIGGSTLNYDGVWVFAKYRACTERTALNPAAFQHMWFQNVTGTLTAPTPHTVPAGVSLEPGITQIAATNRVVGFYIYRTADQSPAATFTTTGYTLLWDQAAQGTAGGNWDIKLFAIESVWVPTGAFNVGDGVAVSRFYNSTGTAFPYQVASEAAIAMQSGTGIYATSSYANGGTLPAAFPKGYTGFWAMKYEITQSQYVEFLNSLSRLQQTSRVETNIANPTVSIANRFVMSNTASATLRNGIRCDATISPTAAVTFYNDLNGNGIANETDDGQNVACNYLSRQDVFAFLDWAALRPLSELQYEKLCRGLTDPLQAPSEAPWGVDATVAGNVTFVTSISNPGRTNELGSPTGNGQVVFGNSAGVQGPMRVGQSFRAATNRIQAAAGYYGAADLAGNLEELVVGIYTSVGQGYISSSASYGDGNLNVNGGSDLVAAANTAPAAATPWPLNQCQGGCSGCQSMSWATIYRGGSWADTDFAGAGTGRGLISSRYQLEYYTSGSCQGGIWQTDTRSSVRGARGCR